MIDTIQSDIIDQLSNVEGVVDVGVWQGDIDDLLKTPQRLPALYVIYQGADFDPFEQAGDLPTATMDFLIVLVGKSLKSRSSGAGTCYGIIEAVRTALIAHQVEDIDFLRPVKEELIMAEGGLLVYGLTYRMTNVLWEGE